MNQHRCRQSSLGSRVLWGVVVLTGLMTLGGAGAEDTLEFVAVTPGTVVWGACSTSSPGTTCNPPPPSKANVTAYVTMLQSNPKAATFSVVLPNPKNASADGAQPIAASAQNIKSNPSTPGTVTYTIGFPITKDQNGLNGFIIASQGSTSVQHALSLNAASSVDFGKLSENAFGLSSNWWLTGLMVAVGAVILGVNLSLRKNLPETEGNPKYQLTTRDGVLGRPEWTATASWATNLTAAASLINLTGILGLFSQASPRILSKESYQLLTILFGSMVIFAGAYLALTVRRYKFNPPTLEDVDFTETVDPATNAVNPLVYIARVLRGEYWAQHPAVKEGTMNFVGRYVLSNAILAGAITGQLVLLVFLLLELALADVLPAWLLVPGLITTYALWHIGVRYVYWNTHKQLRVDGFEIVAKDLKDKEGKIVKKGMIDGATGDVNAPEANQTSDEKEKMHLMQVKARRVNALL